MYCHQCGAEIAMESHYCAVCGAGRQEAREPQSHPTHGPATGTPVMTLRPTFVPRLQTLYLGPLAIFLGIWGGGFFGGFLFFFMKFAGLDLPGWLPFMFSGTLCALVLPFVIYRVKRKTFERTTYTFYPDRLDYHEGFFTVVEKTIAFDRVTEVNLRKGPLQAKYGLGTIILSTPATPAVAGRSGIRLNSIQNPDQTYQQIKDLLDHSRATGRLVAV